MIFEHRLVWNTPKNSPEEGSAAVSEADETQAEEQEADPAKAKEDAEASEALKEAEAEQDAADDAAAEDLAKEAENLPDDENKDGTENAPAEPVAPEKEKGTWGQLKDAFSYLSSDFFGDLFKDPGYAIATLLGFFGGSTAAAIAENSAREEAVRESMAEKFTEVLSSYGLPGQISVSDSDISNLKQYKIQSLKKPSKIKNEKDLRKFLDAKREEGRLDSISGDITSLTNLVLDLDRKAPSAEEPIIGESTAEGESIDTATGAPIQNQPEEVEEPKAGFAIAPTGKVNMKKGEEAPFLLHDGRSLKIRGDRVVVGEGSEAKSFKVKAKGVEVVFNSVKPLSGGRFELDIKPASRLVGALKSPKPAPMTEDQVMTMINFLYENKSRPSFATQYTVEGEPVDFEFIAV